MIFCQKDLNWCFKTSAVQVYWGGKKGKLQVFSNSMGTYRIHMYLLFFMFNNGVEE